VVVRDLERAADELYRDGLDRALSCRSSRSIEEHMEIVRLAARTDFDWRSFGGAGLVRLPRIRRRPPPSTKPGGA